MRNLKKLIGDGGSVIGYTIAILGAAMLSACTTAELQTAQNDISAGIQAACNDVMAANKLNPSSPVAPWATSACGSATQVAGLVQNSQTLQWLGALQAQLATPAPAASAVPAAPAAAPTAPAS